MKRKKLIIIISCLIIVLTIIGGFLFYTNRKVIDTKPKELSALPKPEITGGERGELGIDKNINESTIDKYLGRSDSVYRDMRMLEDPGDYEAIGGDRFLSGYIKGFEVVPLPYIIPVTGLPEAVGDTYTGTTLFHNDNGTYVANYEESLDIIKKYFPKDKVIFLMCGGGGYAGMMKNFLISLGWDENKIYNIGGYWYYEGKNNIIVKNEVDGKTTYDFDKVPYHNIDFSKLTKTTNYKEPTVSVKEVKISTDKLSLKEGTSFQLNAIVLPNNATNKSVKWSSNNSVVATVNETGLVKATGAGVATIKATSVDGNIIGMCVVTVNKNVISTRIKLDDISKEAEEFNSYDTLKIENEYGYNPDYYGPDGSFNEKGEAAMKERETRMNSAIDKRVSIFNKLLNDKKNFIVLYRTKNCDAKPYLPIDGAEKLLKEKGYSYLYTYSPTMMNDVYSRDEGQEKVNLDLTDLLSVVIIKEGKIYASLNPDEDSIKSDEEVRNWLTKYIDI